MSTNANPYVVNIVPLQGVVVGITSGSDTAGQITALQANVANLQTMVDYETGTISADYITSFTHGNTIQITENINLSSIGLYSNGTLVNLTSGATSGTSSNTISSITFTTLTSIAGTPSTMSFNCAGNDVLKITDTGMLQYMSSPTHLSTGINVSGFVYVSEDAYVKSIFQTSDSNQMSSIQTFSTSLDKVLNLKPCSFAWKASGEADLGFIAQEVKTVWPSLSNGTSIAYSRFIPLLLEGLRELNGRVSTLESKM